MTISPEVIHWRELTTHQLELSGGHFEQRHQAGFDPQLSQWDSHSTFVKAFTKFRYRTSDFDSLMEVP